MPEKEKRKRSRSADLTPEEREYRKFRTGYTYREVSDMIWYREEWHQAHHTRRRHAVLGLWKQIKREIFEHYQHMKANDQVTDTVPF